MIYTQAHYWRYLKYTRRPLLEKTIIRIPKILVLYLASCVLWLDILLWESSSTTNINAISKDIYSWLALITTKLTKLSNILRSSLLLSCLQTQINGETLSIKTLNIATKNQNPQSQRWRRSRRCIRPKSAKVIDLTAPLLPKGKGNSTLKKHLANIFAG